MLTAILEALKRTNLTLSPEQHLVLSNQSKEFLLGIPKEIEKLVAAGWLTQENMAAFLTPGVFGLLSTSINELTSVFNFLAEKKLITGSQDEKVTTIFKIKPSNLEGAIKISLEANIFTDDYFNTILHMSHPLPFAECAVILARNYLSISEFSVTLKYTFMIYEIHKILAIIEKTDIGLTHEFVMLAIKIGHNCSDALKVLECTGQLTVDSIRRVLIDRELASKLFRLELGERDVPKEKRPVVSARNVIDILDGMEPRELPGMAKGIKREINYRALSRVSSIFFRSQEGLRQRYVSVETCVSSSQPQQHATHLKFE
jgi:hypothetical protein